MRYIERESYLNRLKGLIGTSDIKIITGIRRCGKSELMRHFIDYLKENDKSSNIIYIDFYDIEFEELKDYKKLSRYITDKIISNKNNYVFIDEVQLCKNFEITINSLHNKKMADIYITGSNAFLLSSDLATLFTGRYIEIQMFPFSFSEFAQYYDNEKDIEELFDSYVMKGGLPGSYEYSKEIDRISYLKDVYNTIVNRDLVNKYNFPDTLVLDHLADYMMDNIANLSSPNKISDNLSNNKFNTNHVTIGKYIKYLCNAYLFYDVKGYDIKGKKHLETADKYYLSDLGIRFAKLGSINIDFGRCYENLICLELLRRGYEVYVGKLYQKEIDFVAIKKDEKLYIQVADNITETKTFNREVDSLLKIKDAYPKMLLARTRHDEYQYEGIKIINLVNWLKDVNK